MYLVALVVAVAAQSLMGVSVRGSYGEQGNMVLAVGLHFFDSVVLDLDWLTYFVECETNGQPMGMASRRR